MEKEKILIADDEERIRDMIKEYVSLEGYDIEEASDGVEALNLFRQDKYSLIILDVMMRKWMAGGVEKLENLMCL